MLRSAQTQPSRPAVWLFGEAGGVQVWAVEGDSRIKASVRVGRCPPIVLLNRAISGTPDELVVISWALGLIDAATAGFYVLCA